jgi:phosphomannomutase
VTEMFPPDGADTAELLRRALAWRNDDPDSRTREELDLLFRQAVTDGLAEETTSDRYRALRELADRFCGPLEFGTAGLRGAIGAGPHRMNRAVVIRTTAGLASYLSERVPSRARVVVGFDARTDSDVYAADTCAVLTAAGCDVWVFPRPLPTPILAHAVLRKNADAGVMITASHNPAGDNGYKLYLGGRIDPGSGRGAQIVAPLDREIAEKIDAVGSTLLVPRAERGWRVLDDSLIEGYLQQAVGLLAVPGPRNLTIVATPLHGVGGEILTQALVKAGFPTPYLVPEQAEPDPRFPTVTFPNPEEAGVLDLGIAAAQDKGAHLLLANDPDADRCAVAAPDPFLPRDGSGTVSWRMLRGDEVGVLLAEHILTRGPLPLPRGRATISCSIVSSRMLAGIAAFHGVRHVETLTGFKWISRVDDLLYGYEEALGYCVAPDLVRDKDGITAALLVAELTAQLAEQGRTLWDLLDELSVRHGLYLTDQVSLRVDTSETIRQLMGRLRGEPPERLAGHRVVRSEDLAVSGSGLPSTDALRYYLADGSRVIVRPSGTEPKVKCYLETITQVPDREALGAVRSSAEQHLSTLHDRVTTMLSR